MIEQYLQRSFLLNFIKAQKHLGLFEDYVKTWDDELGNAGFVPVKVRREKWDEMSDWAYANIGEDYFTWLNHTFWFQSTDDAELFRRKYG